MSVEENKALLRAWFDPPEGWEKLNNAIHGAEDPKVKIEEFYRKARLEVFAPDFVYHDTRGDMDLESYIQFDTALWMGVPDMNISIKDIVGEEDRVMARFHLAGTHKGDFLGIPATGKELDMGGMLACRIVEGKFTELWVFTDRLGLMQRLGVVT